MSVWKPRPFPHASPFAPPHSRSTWLLRLAGFTITSDLPSAASERREPPEGASDPQPVGQRHRAQPGSEAGLCGGGQGRSRGLTLGPAGSGALSRWLPSELGGIAGHPAGI